MNRTQRRKFTARHSFDRRAVAALRHEARDVFELDVLTPAELQRHAQAQEMLNAVLYWRSRCLHTAKCLFCASRFAVAIAPPPYFFLARGICEGPKHFLVAAICATCAVRPDRDQLYTQVLQPFFPGASILRPQGGLQ